MKHGSAKGRMYKVIDIPGTPEITVPNGWWLATETTFASTVPDISIGSSVRTDGLTEQTVLISPEREVRRNVRSVSFVPFVSKKVGAPFVATGYLWHARKLFVVAVIMRVSYVHDLHGPDFPNKEHSATTVRFVFPKQVHDSDLLGGTAFVQDLEEARERARDHCHTFVMLSELAKIMHLKPQDVIEVYGFLRNAAEGFDQLFMHAESQDKLAQGIMEKYLLDTILRELSAVVGKKGGRKGKEQTIDKVWVPLELANQLIILRRCGLVNGETDLFPSRTFI